MTLEGNSSGKLSVNSSTFVSCDMLWLSGMENQTMQNQRLLNFQHLLGISTVVTKKGGKFALQGHNFAIFIYIYLPSGYD